MERICNEYQTADWTKEKHVPVIDCPDKVSPEEFFDVSVTLGKEIAHPNTTEHHIDWINLYYKPEGEKFVYELGNYGFKAHGASTQGPNTGPAHTNHSIVTRIKLAKTGTLYATAYCNIHGLWEYSKPIQVG